MKRIIHLDDHTLFTRAVQALLQELAESIFYHPFHHPDAALQDIKNCLEAGTPLRAIITDFTHPGQNGYEFSCAVRAFEKHYGQRVPILLLTMMGPEHESIRKGLEEKVFDHYLSKACTKEELLHVLNRL